jgi:ATP-dependent Clp protease adapter protein ClpS
MNGFPMVEPTRYMVYQPNDPITLDEFVEQLDIMTLYDATLV